ncbi:MAG: hypothetical protein S4CHLAM45_14880 [Chlamydiales bacterium]|nr:hypothetical protein [Chlamydiales bacterium]MCH9620105.1 hypothetical protein [Chlamydiales bacterium]MCH9623575.1 hypothetical protein [Chlamydiales bacterium]
MVSFFRIKVFLSLFFLSSTLLGLEREPWFNPLWEFQAIAQNDYFKNRTVQIPKSGYTLNDYSNLFDLALQVSPYPYWDAEVQLDFIASDRTSFNFGGAEIIARYQWLDDTIGEPLSLVTGMSMSFIRGELEENLNAYLSSNYSLGLSVTVGKALYRRCDPLWRRRLWFFGEYLFYNRNTPGSFRSTLAYDQRILPCLIWKLHTHYQSGYGTNDLPPTKEGFFGYHNIDFHVLNVETKMLYEFPIYGSFELSGLYNVVAFNGPKNYWGIGGKLVFPFSL